MSNLTNFADDFTFEKPILFSTPMVQAILEGRKTQTRRVIKDESCGILHSQIVPKKAGDIHWFYHWDLEKKVWGRNEIIIQQNCFCFEGEIQRYVNPRDIAKGTKLFPYQSSPRLCPYGQIGDRLWVRETFADLGDLDSGIYTEDQGYVTGGIVYRADDVDGAWDLCKCDGIGFKWKPSIHMPRSAARITLEITDIRVERLQDISKEDAIAEGVERDPDFFDYEEIYNEDGYFLDYQRDVFSSDCDAKLSFKSLWDSINAKKHPWESNPWVWVIEFKRIER